jgi:hypothetical protein
VKQTRALAGSCAGRLVLFFALWALGGVWSSRLAEAQGQNPFAPCMPPAPNAIVCENSKPGSPESEWDIDGVGDASIQGFATEISVNRGETVRFKIDTPAHGYRLDIYRLGYYGGLGARFITTVDPFAPLPQDQPSCLTNASTGLVDCGNWAESASWLVPSDAVSGIYVAKLVREDGVAGESHVVFVVRDDTGASDLLFQTSDTTWQAYNSYGGNSLYEGSPVGRAYKVSYNRPFNTRGHPTYKNSWLFDSEYPMLRWLEANGYNVSYFSGVDSDRRGAAILAHRVFLSVGHDEYWSAAQRAHVQAARDAGVHLAFLSGNSMFWKTRWENSIDGSGTPYRTLVAYKETLANAKIDPLPNVWTGTWRDPRFSPPADGGQPENALMGTLFTVNCCRQDAIRVPAELGKLRFWRNTSVATLPVGTSVTVGPGTVGFEWEEDLDNGFRPEGLIRLSENVLNVSSYLQDYGGTYGPGTATHSLTLYRHSSGALVFGAGTVRWAWGLDDFHDLSSASEIPPPDARMRQATVNLLADMGVQAATLQPGLIPASPSTDTVPPTSTITSPTTGSTVAVGSSVTVTGTAMDGGGGGVAAVDVSVDGGATWSRATGRETWTFTWTPTSAGSVTLKSSGIDDSGNIETPSSGITVTVGTPPPQTCPCSLWSGTTTPAVPADPDASPIELGVKFQADVAGYITGLRFYKGATNTGPHVGSLWTSTGTLLGNVTFTGETGSGWQEVSLSTPVAITANTTYVASYHTTAGHYAVNGGYFATAGVINPPLRALATGPAGGNGLYLYGSGGFPTQAYNGNNYWVDVVFATTAPPPPPGDTTPPTVTGQTPAPGATGVEAGVNVTATFSEALDGATVTGSTVELRDPANALVAATVTYDPGTRTATLDPTGALTPSTTYTARVRGGASDPRVKDAAGNALAADATWTFTTAAAGVPAGLVAAYAFNEGSGSTVADASGHGHAGTISGATWTTGKYGQALSFDGTNDWVTIADSNLLDLTTGMTLSAWVYLTANTGWRTVIIKERVGNEVYTLHANTNQNRPQLAIVSGGSGQLQVLGGPARLALNLWTHLAATYNGTVLRLFVNGVEVASRAVASGAVMTSGAPLRIGGNSIWGEFFKGLIDEVRIYNRALSGAEIQTDMATPLL